jgi:molybdenum cofactor synthesis domain-containing protein
MKELPAIELYSIGTELLMGQIQDTNAFWMAQEISHLGGYVRRMGVLDDKIEELVEVFQGACQRNARFVITTGGLGPTPDDMTVDAIAQAKGVEVVEEEDLVQHFMKTRDIAKREDVRPALLRMARLPVGSSWYPNPAGVAPCVETQVGETTIYSIPGPPREMKALFEQSLAGPIGQLYSGTRATVRVVVNLPESECGPILHKVMAAHPDTYLKAFVALSERTQDGQRLPVDVVARGDDMAAAQALLAAALGMFRELAGEKGRAVEIMEV